MGVFCDRLKLVSTAALDCRTGQNKGRYRKKRALIPTRLSLADKHFHLISFERNVLSKLFERAVFEIRGDKTGNLAQKTFP